jgi:hypothetical protein
MILNRIEIPTWIIHGVCDGNGGVVYHTHGLDEYGSLELELNLALNGKQAMQFINIIGLEIANGKKFKDGDIDDTIFSAKTAFREVTPIEGDKDKKVLRIIFQDPNFLFPWEEGCEEPYKSQI